MARRPGSGSVAPPATSPARAGVPPAMPPTDQPRCGATGPGREAAPEARVTVLSPRDSTTVSHNALSISKMSILHSSHASFVRSTPHTPWGRELQSLRWTQARHVRLTDCLSV